MSITQTEKGRLARAREFVPKGWRGVMRGWNDKVARDTYVAEMRGPLPIIVKEDVDSGKGRVIHAPGLDRLPSVHFFHSNFATPNTKGIASKRVSTPADLDFAAAKLSAACKRPRSESTPVFTTRRRSELYTIPEVEERSEGEREDDLGDVAIAGIANDERTAQHPSPETSESLDGIDGHNDTDSSESALPEDIVSTAIALRAGLETINSRTASSAALARGAAGAIGRPRKCSDASSTIPELGYDSDAFSEEGSVRSSITSFAEEVSEVESVIVVEMKGVQRVSMEYGKAKMIPISAQKAQEMENEQLPPPQPSVLISGSPSSDIHLAYMSSSHNSKTTDSIFEAEADEFETIDIWQDQVYRSESNTSSMRAWASQRSLGVGPYQFPKPPVLLNASRSTSSSFRAEIEKSLRDTMGRFRGEWKLYRGDRAPCETVGQV